ncbi:MAG: hypothetical protein RLZZ444_276 [Pseudomonadota bacterium]
MMAKTDMTLITVRAAPGQPRKALVQAGPLTFRAAIGRSGRSSRKREGDGATPITAMPILYGFYRADQLARPSTSLPMIPIRSSMLWCDSPADANYNRLVRAPFSPSHEKMMRDDHLYDICLVMDWNISSRRRSAGSAIFFHLAKPGYKPTEGCVAVRRGDMLRLLKQIRKGTRVRIL